MSEPPQPSNAVGADLCREVLLSVGFQGECWSAPRCPCLERPVLTDWQNRKGRWHLQCGLATEGAARSEDSDCSSKLRSFKEKATLNNTSYQRSGRYSVWLVAAQLYHNCILASIRQWGKKKFG